MPGSIMKTTTGQTVYARNHFGFDPFEWLGPCARIEAISREQGDLSATHCIDPRSGQIVVSGVTRSAPGLVSTTIAMKERQMQFIADQLEACAHDFDRHTACKDMDNPLAWDEILRVCGGVVTTPEHGGTEYEGDEEDMIVSMPVSALDYHKIYRVSVEVTEPTEAVSWVDVDVCHGDLCAGACGPGEFCTFATVSTLEAAGSPWLKKLTFDANGAVTTTTYELTEWTTDGANAVLCLGDYVFIVSDGEALPLLRSRDGGATRTAIAGNADFVGNPPTCIDGIDLSQLIIGGENGYIYASYDGGDTWVTVSAGTATVEDLTRIMICRDDPTVVYAIGANNAFVKSENGGRNWVAVTGPSAGDGLTALDVYNAYDVRVGNDDGELWETEDGGDTWTQSSAPEVGTGAVIRDITHCGCRVSFLALADTSVVSFGVDTEQRLYRNVKEGSYWEIPTGGELAVPARGNTPQAVACCQNGNQGVLVGGNGTDDGFIAIINK